MRAREFMTEMTSEELDTVKNFCDQLWGRLGISVEFTRHFIERLEDERNGKPITPGELIRLFRKEYQMYGKEMTELPSETQGVMMDVMTHINLPFVVKHDGLDTELLAKSVMRKNDFQTTSKPFKIR
jgi:hypothetical protein